MCPMTPIFAVVGVLLLLFGIVLLLLRLKSSLIFGKYPRRGLFHPLKYGIALLVLKYLRQKFYHQKSEELNTTEYLEKMDRAQPLTDNPASYDVVSFMAANASGQKMMITLERRRRGVLKACLYLWLPDEGLLCSPHLPDMMNFTTDGDKENHEFRGGGFYIRPEQCMREWSIRYEGDLKKVGSGKLCPVDMKLKFTSSSRSEYFNYNRDLSAAVIADSIAREAWNDGFYALLKNVDQILEKRVHYEQSGSIDGDIVIGAHRRSIKMNGFRDHSYGTERCLSTIHRYVYVALFLNDGTSMIVGNLSQPTFFLSSLKVGYVCSSAGVYQPITQCNFELFAYGEKGTPPLHQNFMVKTADRDYFVQIEVEDTAIRYMGGGWESKVFNQFVACSVNGVKGQGIAEYLYRHNGGRPGSISCNDPEWYRRVRSFERSLSNGEHIDQEDFVF